MFKEANKSFLIVGFFIIVFLVWMIINQFNGSSSSSIYNEDDWYKEYGVSLNIWPEGEPEKEDWQEILKDCLPKSDNLSKLRCNYILEKINSFEDCLLAGFPVKARNKEKCETSDGRIFIKE